MKGHKVKQPQNVSVNNEDFLKRLVKECKKVRQGCQDGFTNCCICESDYSVQWADVALTLLCEDKIISETLKSELLCKLYDGHRG